MNNRYSGFSNYELDQQAKRLASSERKVMAEVIEALAEIDRRRLYLELGYGSLFAYCTEALGYSNGSAQRRIDAARMMSEMPEIKEELATGKIGLVQVSMVAQSIRQKLKEDPTLGPEKEDKRELLDAIKGQDERTTQATLAKKLDLPIVEREILKAQKDESIRLEITLSKEQFERLQRAREVASHSVVGSWSDIVDHVLKGWLKKNDPLAKTVGKARKRDASVEFSGRRRQTEAVEIQEAKSTKQDAAIQECTYHVLSEQRQTQMPVRRPLNSRIRRIVIQRDRNCRWIDSLTGKLCGSYFQLDRAYASFPWHRAETIVWRISGASAGNIISWRRRECWARRRWPSIVGIEHFEHRAVGNGANSLSREPRAVSREP